MATNGASQVVAGNRTIVSERCRRPPSYRKAHLGRNEAIRSSTGNAQEIRAIIVINGLLRQLNALISRVTNSVMRVDQRR